VHPDDGGARAAQKLGKTEAWYVLAADPDAGLYIGLDEGVAFDAFVREAERLDGSSSRLLRRVPAVPGQTVLIPAGTIHALGAGVIVYEVQQPSDVTYRLDDWGRVDAAGRPREMHLEAGFAASRPELRPNSITPIDLDGDEISWSLLVACRYFALALLRLPAATSSQVGWAASPAVITMLEGAATVGNERLKAGESAIVWAGNPADIDAQEPICALVAWVPDLDGDVIAPAKSQGVPNDAIEALAGDTADIAIDRVDP
jgi:mannose-6-phosphate isomerase